MALLKILDNVIVPEVGTSFYTLGEAYDFYNIYSQGCVVDAVSEADSADKP